MLLATVFGVGFLPVSPGSWASLAALPAAWAFVWLSGAPGLAAAAGVAFAAGWWAAATVAKAGGIEDPGEIVIDEVAGQWLVLVAAPLDPLIYAAAFLLFRILDIWKPWPVRWAERRVKGGLGIMLDDALAAVYAAVLLLVLIATGGVLSVRT